MQEIVAKNAIAACDTTVNRRFMAGYWRFTNSFNDKISKGYICSDSLDLNISGSAESITLMKVLKLIQQAVHVKE